MIKVKNYFHTTVSILNSVAGVSMIGLIAGQNAEAKEYNFGVVPQQSASRLAKIWSPFVSELSRESGLPIRFATSKDIPTFEKCLAKGAFEFAYMNPYHYTVFHDSSGYRAFARQAKKQLQGLLVVRKDSAIKGLKDLDGKSLAFPSPAAFGASVLPRAEMRSRGLTFEPNYVKSHDSVYRSVAAGIFPAGGGVKRTFGRIDETLRSQLRVVYRTKRYTPHAFAASDAVTEPEIKRISDAMMRIAKDKPALVKKLGMSGFEVAQNDD